MPPTEATEAKEKNLIDAEEHIWEFATEAEAAAKAQSIRNANKFNESFLGALVKEGDRGKWLAIGYFKV